MSTYCTLTQIFHRISIHYTIYFVVLSRSYVLGLMEVTLRNEHIDSVETLIPPLPP